MPADNIDPELGFQKSNWPFYWITQTSSRYIQAMEERLKTLGIDPTYWRVMMSLYEDQRLSISEISSYCIIKPNTATKIVQRMQAEGLVETRQRESDARVTEVMLTDKGHELRKSARAVADEVYSRAFDGMSREEQMILNLLLERVFNKLG